MNNKIKSKYTPVFNSAKLQKNLENILIKSLLRIPNMLIRNETINLELSKVLNSIINKIG